MLNMIEQDEFLCSVMNLECFLSIVCALTLVIIIMTIVSCFWRCKCCTSDDSQSITGRRYKLMQHGRRRRVINDRKERDYRYYERRRRDNRKNKRIYIDPKFVDVMPSYVNSETNQAIISPQSPPPPPPTRQHYNDTDKATPRIVRTVPQLKIIKKNPTIDEPVKSTESSNIYYTNILKGTKVKSVSQYS